MKRSPFLLLTTLLLSITLFSCQQEQLQPQNGATPELQANVVSTQTFYHHDGESSHAEKMVLRLLENGTAVVHRSQVAFTEVTNQTFYTALDVDNSVPGPEYSGLYNQGASAWFVPFGSGAAVSMASGGTITIACFCQGEGDCDQRGSIGGGTMTVECYANPCPDAGCGAKIRMGLAHYNSGISFKASSVSLH